MAGRAHTKTSLVAHPRLAMSAILLFALAGYVSADVVHLKDGGKFEGTVTEQGEIVKVVLPGGATVGFSKAEVSSIERKALPVDEYAERAAALAADDMAGHEELAKWCEQNKKQAEADKEWLIVYDLKMKSVAKPTPESEMELAEWARKHRMRKQAEEHLQNIYKVKAAEVPKDDALGQAKLAEWCLENGFRDKAGTHLQYSYDADRTLKATKAIFDKLNVVTANGRMIPGGVEVLECNISMETNPPRTVYTLTVRIHMSGSNELTVRAGEVSLEIGGAAAKCTAFSFPREGIWNSLLYSTASMPSNDPPFVRLDYWTLLFPPEGDVFAHMEAWGGGEQMLRSDMGRSVIQEVPVGRIRVTGTEDIPESVVCRIMFEGQRRSGDDAFLRQPGTMLEQHKATEGAYEITFQSGKSSSEVSGTISLAGRAASPFRLRANLTAYTEVSRTRRDTSGRAPALPPGRSR